MPTHQESAPESREARRGPLVHHLVQEWAERTPDAVAVRSGDRRLTYRQLNAASNRLARTLRRHGVKAESMVAVAVEPSPELVVALLATLKAGGSYVPLDPGYPSERRALMLADAAPACALATQPVADDLGLDPRATTLVDGETLIDDELNLGPDAADLDVDLPESSAAYMMYTSGSTGTPKGVVVDHASIVALVTLDRRIAVRPGEVVMQLSPVAFDAATFELWAPLCSGGTVAITSARQASISELGDQLRRVQPDWLFLTTGLFHLVVDHDIDALAAVGHVLTGGDVLSPRHVARSAAQPRGALYAAYGPTEATTFTSLHRVPVGDAFERVPLGTPLAGMWMVILDADLREVGDGERGEICIGGAGVARGYHRRPGLTAERFVPDPFAQVPGQRLYRTGDLGRWLPNGEIEFLGRIDRQVKVRGFRIELGEIEAALAQCPGVAGSAVTAIESHHHKRVVAYVAPQPDRTLTGSDLRAWLAEKLPPYMLPTTYVVLDEIPLDPNGKVARNALPYPWRRREVPLTSEEMPRNEVEQLMAMIWADALGLDEIGINDDFFDSGGDSLLSVDVLAELRAHGLHIDARSLFEKPTIGWLAPLARRASRAQADAGTLA